MNFCTVIYFFTQSIFFVCLLVDRPFREIVEERYTFLKRVGLGFTPITALVLTNFILIGTFLPEEILFQSLPHLKVAKVSKGDFDLKTTIQIATYIVILFMYFVIKIHLRLFKVTKQ